SPRQSPRARERSRPRSCCGSRRGRAVDEIGRTVAAVHSRRFAWPLWAVGLAGVRSPDWPMLIGPSRLDQRATRRAIARLGDRTLAATLAGGILARNQSQVGHELARMAKAGEIAQFGNDTHRVNELDSAAGL